MGHADDDLLDPFPSSPLDQFVHQGDQGFTSFQGEPLLADIAGMQIALHPFRRREQGQQPAAIPGLQLRLGAVTFQAFLDPALFRDAGDVHVLRTNRAAVNFLQQGDDVAQPHAVGGIEGAGMEGLLHIGFRQLVEGGVQVRDRWPFTQMDGINLRRLVAAETVGVDEAQHGRLLLRRRRFQPFLGTDHGPEVGLPGQPEEVLLDRAMGDFIGSGAAHDVKALSPGQIHALGIGQVLLVQVFDEGGIASIQGARGAEHLDQGAHGGDELRGLNRRLSTRL